MATDTPHKIEAKLNRLLDFIIDDVMPIIYRLMVVGFVCLAFLGAIIATTDFNMMHGAMLYFNWDNLLTQASFMLFWPLSLAPLWWKLSFFIIGFLILLPRALVHGDP